VVGLIGGITGVYGVSKLSQRSDLARAGFLRRRCQYGCHICHGALKRNIHRASANL